MPHFARKTLWVVSIAGGAHERLLHHARACGADAVCIRTDNADLPAAIGRFHAEGIEVLGWRWPAVVPRPESRTHYYALDEADHVARVLIPAGLDGYVLDAESEPGSPANDWNDAALAPLARALCETIRNAARPKPGFLFGVTSHCDHPATRGETPWSELVAASGALFPQCYWRIQPASGPPRETNGGTPEAAVARGIESWRAVAGQKPVIPMAGELGVITPHEIAAYAARLRARGLDVHHFYADADGIGGGVLEAIRAI